MMAKFFYMIKNKEIIREQVMKDIIAGIILVIMGLLRFGSLIKYISQTITIGFTAGIAITLISTQIKDFFGLQINNMSAESFEKWKAYFENVGSLNRWALIIGVVCLKFYFQGNKYKLAKNKYISF